MTSPKSFHPLPESPEFQALSPLQRREYMRQLREDLDAKIEARAAEKAQKKPPLSRGNGAAEENPG